MSHDTLCVCGHQCCDHSHGAGECHACKGCSEFRKATHPQLHGGVSSEAEDKDADLFFEVVEALSECTGVMEVHEPVRETRQGRNGWECASCGAYTTGRMREIPHDQRCPISKARALLLKCTPEKIKQYEASRMRNPLACQHCGTETALADLYRCFDCKELFCDACKRVHMTTEDNGSHAIHAAFVKKLRETQAALEASRSNEARMRHFIEWIMLDDVQSSAHDQPPELGKYGHAAAEMLAILSPPKTQEETTA